MPKSKPGTKPTSASSATATHPFLAAETRQNRQGPEHPRRPVTVLQAKPPNNYAPCKPATTAKRAPQLPGGAPAPALPNKPTKRQPAWPICRFRHWRTQPHSPPAPGRDQKKSSDKMSTFEQKQMGSGAQDYRAQFKQQLADPLTTNTATSKTPLTAATFAHQKQAGPDISRRCRTQSPAWKRSTGGKDLKQLQRSLV